MAVLELTKEQVFDLVRQMPPEEKREMLLLLAQGGSAGFPQRPAAMQRLFNGRSNMFVWMVGHVLLSPQGFSLPGELYQISLREESFVRSRRHAARPATCRRWRPRSTSAFTACSG